MTEKRFEINNLAKKGGMSFWDNENKSILNTSHTLDLLNNLSEENEQLKKDCSNLIDDNTEYVSEINQMHKENEQLKQKIKSITEILNEDIGYIESLKKIEEVLK